MATIVKTGGGVGNIPHNAGRRAYILSAEIDLTAGAITQGDVYQCLAVPTNTLIESVHFLQVTPAVGTTLTMNIGDTGSTAGWMASVDGKAAAATADHSTVGTDARAVAANNGFFVAAKSTIDVVMTTATAITAGPKFKLFAVCYDLN